MSIDYNTYLGPFFRCKTRTDTVTVTIPSCPNVACDRHGKELLGPPVIHRYCNACGMPIDPSFAVDAEGIVPDQWEVTDAIHEALSLAGDQDAEFDEAFHRWIPNKWREPPRIFDCSDISGIEFAVDPAMIGAEVAWLTAAFSAERATLAKIYGEAMVEVRWGLLKWYS